MTYRRRAAILITTALAVLGLAASPAQALTGYARCEGWGFVCTFNGPDGTGTMTYVFGSAARCSNMPASANNTADSFINKREGNTSHHVQFYDGANCTGERLGTYPYGWEGPYESGYRSSFYEVPRAGGHSERNKVSSVWFNTG
jgi:hypothetical protein